LNNTDQKVIFIRVDASYNIGLGHLKRSLEIALQLKKKNCKPILVLNTNFQKDSLPISFDTIVLSSNLNNEFVDLCKQFNCQAVLFDILADYQAPRDINNLRLLLKSLMREKFFTVGIGPYDPVSLPFNIQINPYRFIDRHGFVSGFDYLVISSEIIQSAKNNDCKPKRLLVSFGGSDIHRATYHTIRMLKKSKVIVEDWDVDICLGPFFDKEHVNLIKEIAKDIPNFDLISGGELHSKMHQYQFGVISGGLTKFECAYLGIPVAIVSQSDDEKDRAIEYSKKGAAHYLCSISNLSQDSSYFAHEIESIIQNSKQLIHMKHKGQVLVDGLGSERIAKLIVNAGL